MSTEAGTSERRAALRGRLQGFLDRGDHEGIEDLASALEEFPDEIEFLAKLADAALARGDLLSALRRYQALADRFPDQPWGDFGLARTEAGLDHRRPAIARLARLLERHPDFRPGLVAMAELQADEADHAQAAATWKRIVALDPGAPDAHRSLTMNLLASGDTQGAALAVAAAHSSLGPDREHDLATLRSVIAAPNPGSHAGRAVARRAARLDRLSAIRMAVEGFKDRGFLETLLGSAIGDHPDAIDLAAVYADIALDRGDFLEAVRRFQAVAERFPAEPWGEFGLARTEAKLGQPSAARKRLERLYNRHPDFTPALVETAEIASSERKWGEAARAWKNVVARAPDNRHAAVSLVRALLRAGDHAEAAAALVTLAEEATDLDDEIASLTAELADPASRPRSVQLERPPKTEIRDRRIRERLGLTAIFDPKFYVSEVPGGRANLRNAVDDYAKVGSFDRVRTCSALSIARLLGEIESNYDTLASEFRRSFEAAQESDRVPPGFLEDRLFGIFVHSRANYYMRPIAECVVAALRSAGAQAELLTELDPSPERATFPIVVAPHEFFIFEVPDYFRSEHFAARYIAFNTEQLPSPWFKDCFAELLGARAVIDVNFQSSIALSSALPTLYCLPAIDDCIRTQYLQELDRRHPLVQWLDPTVSARMGERVDWDQRPIDVFFAGFATPNRDHALIRAAPYLATKNSFLAYATKTGGTSTASGSNVSIFPNNLGVASLTKVVLNIHRYAVGFFEWERMIAHGFLSGACVVASPSMRSPYFEPGVHYFESNAARVVNLLSWLLDTEEGGAAARRAVDAASAILERDLTPVRVGRHLLHFLASLPELE